MLIVKNIRKVNEEEYESEWSLSTDQMNFLITYAINSLIAQGLINVEEHNLEVEAEQEMKDFLNSLNSKDLPKA